MARIQEYGWRRWRNGVGIKEREQQYVHMKSQPKNEKYANGSMVRGGVNVWFSNLVKTERKSQRMSITD